MQNRYVGDIGDYVKLAILRELARGRSLGVAWWLLPDENHNGDGGHREYLDRPKKWRRFDPTLFDALLALNKETTRDIRALEDPSLLPNAVFAPEQVPCEMYPSGQRPEKRRLWLLRIKTRFQDRDLVFLDPDNGIAPHELSPTQRCAGKSVLIGEMQELKEDHRAIVIYHHHSRRKGGHTEELCYLANRLRDSGFRVCGALRAKPWSPRAFFILDGDEDLCSRACKIAQVWDGWISWHPDL